MPNDSAPVKPAEAAKSGGPVGGAPEPKRKATIVLRIVGVVAIIGGALVWWYGGKEYVVSYKDIVLPVPLELVLVCGGLLLASLPLVFFYALAGVMPYRPVRKRLFRYAESLDPEGRRLSTAHSPESFAVVLKRHFERANQRFYLSVPIILILISLVCAYLFYRGISLSNFKRSSNQLVALSQETRIDFSSADHIRERLQEGADTMTSKSVSTKRMYDILERLYDPAPKTVDEFNKRVSAVYENEIRPHAERGTSSLELEAFNFKASASESERAPASYITLLATVCNYEGDHGIYIDPYLQSYQLLQLARSSVREPANLPATHNALGISLAGILKSYPAFAIKFSKDPELMRTSLHMKTLPSRLALLREAKSEYEIAAKQTSSNLAQARSLNNRIDLLLIFLDLVHIKQEIDSKDIGDDTDRNFLESELAAKLPGKPWQPLKLIALLDRWKNQLDEALDLSRQPEIYFTRAQLYAIGGKLGEQYKLQHRIWGAPDLVAGLGVADLSTAASMNIPKNLFDRNRAGQLYLDWLWTRPKFVPTLEQLSSQDSE